MTAFTLPWRWHFISGKPCWAEWIKSFTITLLSASSSQDFLELESRTDFCPLMCSWSAVLGALKQQATSWTERTSLLSSASWYAASACWSCTSFAFEASLLITVVPFVHNIADREIVGWPLSFYKPQFLVYAGSWTWQKILHTAYALYLHSPHSKHAMKGHLPAWGPIRHQAGHFWPYSAWGAHVQWAKKLIDKGSNSACGSNYSPRNKGKFMGNSGDKARYLILCCAK